VLESQRLIALRDGLAQFVVFLDPGVRRVSAQMAKGVRHPISDPKSLAAVLEGVGIVFVPLRALALVIGDDQDISKSIHVA
jgi:hypothetical protein